MTTFTADSNTEAVEIAEREIGGVMEAATADYEQLLIAALPDMEKWHQSYFSTETDPSGTAWPDLAAITIKRKGHDTILVDLNNLKSSLVEGHQNAVRDIEEQGDTWVMWFGTSDPKAKYHQTGTVKMPARPAVGLNEEKVNELATKIADGIMAAISKV